MIADSKTLDYDSVKFALDTNILENSTTKPDSSTSVSNENENITENPKKSQTSDAVMEDLPNCNGDSSMVLDSTFENKTMPNCNGDRSMVLDSTFENKAVPNCNGDNSMVLDSTFENKTVPNCNGDSMVLDSTTENKIFENGSSTKENISDVNSPLSFNDNESIHTADENHISELDNTSCSSVKYVEVCQKAFMNMYGITEKRIRWQREKLILRSRYLAEKKKKELEEMDRTLSLARSLGAGCQPLFAFLEKSNCKQLSEQLLVAIEDDVMLVNNFFHNQLWKPEDIMNKSVHFSTLDSCEAECD